MSVEDLEAEGSNNSSKDGEAAAETDMDMDFSDGEFMELFSLLLTSLILFGCLFQVKKMMIEGREVNIRLLKI